MKLQKFQNQKHHLHFQNHIVIKFDWTLQNLEKNISVEHLLFYEIVKLIERAHIMYESLFFTYMHVPLLWITSVFSSTRAVCMAWYRDVTDRNFEIIWTYAATDYFIILWESILIDDFKMYFLFLLKLKIIVYLLSGTIRYIRYDFFKMWHTCK